MKQLSMLMSLVLIACSSSSERGSASGAILAQSIAKFHRPESVAFSIDGKYLFVGNCASDLFGADKKKVGFVTGAGAISRCTVDEEGVCEIESLCPTRTNWRKINEAVIGALRGVTLADMTPQMAPFVPHRPYEPVANNIAGGK